MKIGVAIPVHNEVDAIERCLSSLAAQTRHVDAYLALDAPTDGTARILVDNPGWYTKLAAMPHRSGWPRTLNAAADLALGDGVDTLVVMDADNYLRPDAVALLGAEIDNGADWAVCHGQQVGGTNTLQVPLRPFPLTLDDFGQAHPPIGSFAIMRACIWRELGGYADDVALPDSYGYNEDWDFWIRAMKAGYTRSALVTWPVHFYVMSDKQLHRAGVHRHAEARKLIMDKHPDVFAGQQWQPCGCGCM